LETRIQENDLEIETARLLLREFTMEDWPEVMAYMSDPRYQRFYPESDISPETIRELMVERYLDDPLEPTPHMMQLAITIKPIPQVVGSCGVRMDSPDAVKADIGYELLPAVWGRGYATEAAGAMVRHGFETFKVHRIWAHCTAENMASRRVLEKLGLRREGQLRENEYFRGRWWDTLIYGILESEWREFNGLSSSP
jgi:RimJ/RimL family protein N-acetyltransferase